MQLVSAQMAGNKNMRSGWLAIVFAAALLAADKPPVPAAASTDLVEFSATPYTTKAGVQELLGSDLGGYFIVIKMTVTPRGGKPLAVSHDDFLLRSFGDGQKSGVFEPSQIAGRGALVVSSGGRGGGVGADQGGPVWGPGPGGMGMPRRLPGNNGTFGNAPSSDGTADAKVDNGAGEKDNPLLAVLKQKVLPEKTISEPLSGLLYFSLEGKHKPKNLALEYKGPAGKLRIEFK